MQHAPRIRVLLAALAAVIPFFALRRAIYRVLLKYDLDSHSRIAPFTILVAERVTMRGADIGPFNILKLEELVMDEGASIRKFNRVSGIQKLCLAQQAIILNSNFIGGTWGKSLATGKEVLDLGPRSQITLRAFIDLNDSITFGADVVVGGVGTQFWTHGFDCYRNRLTGPIQIDSAVFIGAGCLVLPGVSICSEVTVGAGSVIHRSITEPGLYVSSKLIRKT